MPCPASCEAALTDPPGFLPDNTPDKVCDVDRRWENSLFCRLPVFSDRIYHRKQGNGGQENRLNSRFFQQPKWLPSASVAAVCHLSNILSSYRPSRNHRAHGSVFRTQPGENRQWGVPARFVKRPENAVLWRYQGDAELPEFRPSAPSRWGCLSAFGAQVQRFHRVFDKAPTPEPGQITPGLQDCPWHRKLDCRRF